jgi:hypothetical protein
MVLQWHVDVAHDGTASCMVPDLHRCVPDRGMGWAKHAAAFISHSTALRDKVNHGFSSFHFFCV